jgi:hypothetical protein
MAQEIPGFSFADFSGEYAFYFSTGIGPEPSPKSGCSTNASSTSVTSEGVQRDSVENTERSSMRHVRIHCSAAAQRAREKYRFSKTCPSSAHLSDKESSPCLHAVALAAGGYHFFKSCEPSSSNRTPFLQVEIVANAVGKSAPPEYSLGESERIIGIVFGAA